MTKTVYTNEHKQLVTKLIAARKVAGLHQHEVSEKLHVTQSYISKLELGLPRRWLITADQR